MREVANKTWRCRLCDRTYYGRRNAATHLEGRHHFQQAQAAAVWRRETANHWENAVLPLEARIEGLCHQPWRDEMYSLLYRDTFKKRDNNQNYYDTATTKIVEYEHADRIALLELAAWKAVCILNPPNPSILKTYHSWKAWESKGWKSIKETVSDANEIGIVVQRVLPFLCEQKKNKSKKRPRSEAEGEGEEEESHQQDEEQQLNEFSSSDDDDESSSSSDDDEDRDDEWL
jgi:hypothetical protein